MKVKSESEVSQSCTSLSDPMDCSLPGPSIHGIFQARVLEWGAITFSVQMHMEYQTDYVLDHKGFLGGSAGKNPLVMQETLV